jgi:hypothetical protein
MDGLPEVRIAAPADEPAIMAMCRRLWEENGMFSYNEDRVRATLHRCYAAQGVIVGVIGSDPIEASTCLAIAHYGHYTDDWHLEELWNFVDEPFRRGRNAEALIEFGKGCSDRMGIPLVTGIITNKQMIGKVRLYRRRLGQPTGAFFIYNGKWNVPKDEPADHEDLRRRLLDFAGGWEKHALPKGVARDQLPGLLREAALEIRKFDDLWMTGPPRHVNGSG